MVLQTNKKGPGSGGTLLKGAAILAAAAVVSKLLGTAQKIPLQNLAGDEVFGLYHAVYPIYILILTLVTAGFPLVVSKFVAESAATGNLREAKRVLRTAVWLLSLTGAVGCLLLYSSAGWLAASMGMREAEPGIQCIAFALLLAPPMAAYRGFFQGLQDMAPTAASQVAEQFVRVGVMLGLLVLLVNRGEAAGIVAAGAAFGSTAGAAVGLLVAWWYWIRWNRQAKGDAMYAALPGKGEGHPPVPLGRLVRRLIGYAVPICLGAIAMPVLTIVDVWMLPRLLAGSGGSEAEAAYRFGLYNHGLPLVQLVLLVAASMSAALVPAIAQAAASGDGRHLAARTGSVLRVAWLLALPAAVGLALTAAPVNVMLFRSPEGWPAMAVLAFTALLGTLHTVSGAALQGLGAVMVPARSLFVAAGVKAAGNLLLVPAYGITGAAVAAVMAYTAAAALNLWALGLRVPGGLTPLLPRASLLRSLAAVLLMSAAVLAVEGGLLEALRHEALSLRARHTVAVLTAVLAGAITYGAALLKLGVLNAAELEAIPGFTSRWKPVLAKLRLLPKGDGRSI